MKSVFRIRNLALLAFVSTGLLTTPLQAGTMPQNLGYGLDKLVESHLDLKAQNAARKPGEPQIVGSYNGWTTEVAAGYAADAIADANTGRFLVDITLRGTVPVDQVQAQIERRFRGFTVTAVDAAYRGVGIIEGFTRIEDVAALSQMKGVRAVMLGLKPSVDRAVAPAETRPGAVVQPDPVNNQVFTKLGTAFDQGVFQHRIDQISQVYNPSAAQNITGNGISIGAMSDSFDTRAAAPHAADNVASFDLPGAPTNPVNTKPVAVLIDDPAAGTDEGRGMVQNIYKMAPKARLAYATGVTGEVAFGNYIRAMSGIAVNPAPFPNPPAGNPNGVFKADIICDDISYGGEPFYGESIIGNAVDEATAVGVSYFSSAGNNIGINAYESPLRIVPNGSGLTAAAGNTALANTNINLTGVDPALYAGGFHNFNPNPGQLDVAGLWNMPTGSPGSTEMQWDDPYDIRDPVLTQPAIFTANGSITGAGQSVVYNGTSTPPLPTFTAGTGYVIQETATSGNFDGIVTLTDPNGKVVVSQDTGTDEVVTFYAPISGQYTLTITAFSTTTGNFNVTINTTTQAGVITTDLNLLVFRADTGAYLSTRSLTTNNIANNRPLELGGNNTVNSPAGQTQIQFVIARANIPTAPRLPTRVRVSTRGNGLGGIGPAEYFSYNAVTTKGHATAKGCNGTAAYSVFRPNQPEAFTSPGPATILFDKNANLLATPEIRLVPRVAAIDAANTTDFPAGGDSTGDLDAFANFSGTSSAAPHAAGIAALILEKNGGPGTVTPAQMRTIMQTNVFPHDLDPSFASSVARATNGGKVTITISSDNDTNTSTGQNDPNSIVVSYVGASNITSLVFNPGGTGATGGAVTAGINGYFDNTPTATQVTYFEQDVPGLVFRPVTKAFTLGTLSGMTTTDVGPALFTNQAGVPAPAGDGFFTMTLNFLNGNFKGGSVLRFTVGRGQLRNADVQTGAVGNTPGPGATAIAPRADLFGGGVFIPRNQTVTDGMTYSGTLQDGSTFTGTIKNRIGFGYSVTDGYGLINAEQAVNAPLP